ncbi:hypothetical protein CK203_046640 [Vitis vinifera]|uniref:Uncharacterized protein n=1 Tax=Vitis vinifera TaxID=29760 RepID=A0A438HL88_VITVI|nr:hypothetical protein CK203_046640 [Vitis vinifera]
MHWTSQNGWINQEAEASYEKMLELQKQPVPEGGQALKEAEICVQVLGSRSGYIKGLGHGPRPPSSSSKSTHKSHREIELENELKATRELLQSQETRIQHQQSQIAQLASFVSEMRQHMHIPGSSSRSSSPLDDTPLMDS